MMIGKEGEFGKGISLHGKNKASLLQADIFLYSWESSGYVTLSIYNIIIIEYVGIFLRMRGVGSYFTTDGLGSNCNCSSIITLHSSR